MAVTATPVFTQAPICAIGRSTAADTAHDGSGTMVTIKAAGSNGTRIDRISWNFEVTTTVGTIRFFVHDGSVNRLVYDKAVPLVTVSASVAGHKDEWSRGDGLPVLDLPAGYTLKFSVEKAEACVAVAHGGDY